MSSISLEDMEEAEARAGLAGDPRHRPALRRLARALRRQGRLDEAGEAELAAIRESPQVPALVAAAGAIRESRFADAERSLRGHLAREPDDPAALNMLARVAAEADALEPAERLLRQALDLAPGFVAAWLKLGEVLQRSSRLAEAAEAFEHVRVLQPGHGRATAALAALLARIGDYEQALSLYDQLAGQGADNPDLAMSRGHVLKTIGRTEEAVAAYRRAVAIDAEFGEAWWSLANLKTFRFAEEELAAIARAAESEAVEDKRRLHLHFALGKAYEDRGAAEPAFRHYAEGNRLRRAQLAYDAAALTAEIEASEALLTESFFAARAGWGAESEDPIFVLGMPRAGSTLIEQILSAHSEIEGTSELPYIPAIARDLENRAGGAAHFPDLLAALEAEEARRLGEDYLRRAGAHRKTSKPLFIDKLPNNWRDLALVRLILPRARIIDARREPLDCCVSNFRQHFAEGQAFAYSLGELGRYYRDYVRLMRHFDRALPGWVHRMIHEDLVADPEAWIRRLLADLGLAFEPGCLHFHESGRAVRTPSAEQVRRPINADGIGRWRMFAPWLAPLRQALGPALVDWRN